MLHGKGGSVGCIAVNNSAIEDIFYIVAKVGIENSRILISPWDFRKKELPKTNEPKWLIERYKSLYDELVKIKI